MREYGTIHTSFWVSESIVQLDDRAKLLALYLLTSQHSNMGGIFRLPELYISEDMQWDLNDIQQYLNILEDSEFISRCTQTKWVWIRNYIKWNKPQNPNQKLAIVKMFDQIPEKCSWKTAFWEVYGSKIGAARSKGTGSGTVAEQSANGSQTVHEPFGNGSNDQNNPSGTVSERFRNGFGTVSEQFANQEQEQEQEQEQDQEQDKHKGDALFSTFFELESVLPPSDWVDEITDAWPALDTIDLKSKWERFKKHASGQQYKTTAASFKSEFMKWINADAQAMIDKRAAQASEQYIKGVPMSRIRQHAQAGETADQCATRLKAQDKQQSQPPKVNPALVVGRFESKLEETLYAEYIGLGGVMTPQQIKSAAIHEGEQVTTCLMHLNKHIRNKTK